MKVFLFFLLISIVISCTSTIDFRDKILDKQFVQSSNGSLNPPPELSKGSHENDDALIFVGIGEGASLEEAKEKARLDARQCLVTSLKNLTTVKNCYDQHYKSKYSFDKYVIQISSNHEIMASYIVEEYWKEERETVQSFEGKDSMKSKFTCFSGIRWTKQQFLHALQQL
ncbi:MAG: hypothetical protein HUU50_02790 [Candidatus Brocadiae bacterium]|nr:hypothetical protein [Candidatus Brocadiia bacterium]